MSDPFDINDLSRIVDHLGYGKFQHLLFVLCGIGWAADIGELFAATIFVDKVPEYYGITNNAIGGLIASAPFLGMLLGANVFGILADRMGRKPVFMMTCLIAGIGGIICATSMNFWMFVFFRVIVGFGLGGNLPIDFSMFLEFVPTVHRNSSTVWLTGWSIFGTILTAGWGWLLADQTTNGWRYISVLVALPSLVIALFRTRTPESPYYLLSVNKTDELKNVLQSVAKINGKSLNLVDSHRRPIVKETGRWQELFERPLVVHNIVLMLLWFFMSMGFYGFMVRVPEYLRSRGFQMNPMGMIFISTFAQIPGLLSAIYLIKRFGASVGISVFTFLCGSSILWFCSVTDTANTVLAYILYNASVAGMYGVLYLFTSVNFPTNIRATGFAVCSSMNRVAGIIAPIVSGYLSHGSLTYLHAFHVISFAIATLCAILLSPYFRWVFALYDAEGEYVGYDDRCEGDLSRKHNHQIVFNHDSDSSDSPTDVLIQ